MLNVYFIVYVKQSITNHKHAEIKIGLKRVKIMPAPTDATIQPRCQPTTIMPITTEHFFLFIKNIILISIYIIFYIIFLIKTRFTCVGMLHLDYRIRQIII